MLQHSLCLYRIIQHGSPFYILHFTYSREETDLAPLPTEVPCGEQRNRPQSGRFFFLRFKANPRLQQFFRSTRWLHLLSDALPLFMALTCGNQTYEISKSVFRRLFEEILLVYLLTTLTCSQLDISDDAKSSKELYVIFQTRVGVLPPISKYRETSLKTRRSRIF